MIPVIKSLLGYISNPKHIAFLGILTLFAEISINHLIINLRKYTEIDWVAYMQEVEGFLNGTWDYEELKGDTGPLVYPAGFVYIFSIFYALTGQGHQLRVAQYMFAVIYLLNFALVIRICHKTAKLPPYMLVFFSLMAYRVHSIFVLRMFNDPVTVCIMYLSINLLLDHYWKLACVCYSLAVSVKMSVLLYAPGWLVILLLTHGIYPTMSLLFTYCALPQVLLALPFLFTNPFGYLSRAFEFQRTFLFQWTVNWRFLPEDVFLSPYFHVLLLFGHLVCLLLFVHKRWTRPHGGILRLFNTSPLQTKLSSDAMVSILFESNFIGMAFARSLHYQFYVWYFHTLPHLLWSSRIPLVVRLVVLIIMEWVWNQYPSTTMSSMLLHALHLLIIIGLLTAPITTSQRNFKQS